MPWANNSLIQSLRLQYNAAMTAHKASRQALIGATIEGATPSAELVDAEARARTQLEDIRAKLLAAMTSAIMGSSEIEPPPQT
jgi:hypothetical protein